MRYIWGLPGVQITSGHSQLVTNTDCLRAGARACACACLVVGRGGGGHTHTHSLLMIIDRDKWLRVEIVYMPLIIKQQHNQATIPSEPQRWDSYVNEEIFSVGVKGYANENLWV